jgi:hypothetical protein
VKLLATTFAPFPFLELCTRYAISEGRESQVIAEQFAKKVDTLDDQSIMALSNMIIRNRLTRLSEEIIRHSRSQTGAVRSLENLIMNRIAELHALERERFSVVAKLVSIMVSSKIDYVFFKTFDRFADVGVDVDLLVPLSSYWSCVKALQRGGFIAIDDLSKTYATGFVVQGNPIIVDLHTDITIMGVSYFETRKLFERKHTIELRSSDGQMKESEKINIESADQEIDASLAVAHSVIKENSLKGSDVLKVCYAFNADANSLLCTINEQNLQVAADVFARTLFCISVPIEIQKMFFKGRSLIVETAEAYLNKSLIGSLRLPFTFPVPVSLLALFDRLVRRKELALVLPKISSSLRYKRSVFTLATKALKHTWWGDGS